MENQSDEQHYKLPGEDDIERASLEAARKAIGQVATMQRQERVGRIMALVPAMKVAALVAVASSLAFYFFLKSKPSAPQVFTVATKAGERRRVTLPDGSVAELNAASDITYPAHFGETREVRLSGEAFFKVKRDTAHPFVVHSGEIDVKVLGTSFNVKAYQNDAVSRVTVATGKVGVQKQASSPGVPTPGAPAPGAPAILLPGDQLIFDHVLSSFSLRKVDPKEAADWQQQALSFEFQTLRDISAELGRVYGVTFDIRDTQLAGKRFQLRVKNESLANILKLLSISGDGFSYKIQDKVVIIE
ncbi:FecR domain-containing protein [Dyadobacter sp. CY261]|uniref:FecR family protein n=1 Tax=Dyadobacter sp. CY261 TaxID=2907203 RepID=UPI001F3BC775|nr:FecR domain-containing protein [Dyadobacter sp. CY261]MCF0072902.1 FecR domain-containing protein [Dyadobacter sp. CY261]